MERMPVFFDKVQLDFLPEIQLSEGMLEVHPESPKRAELIIEELSQYRESYDIMTPKPIPDEILLQVVDPKLLELYYASAQLVEVYHPVGGKAPIGFNIARYCFDACVPIDKHCFASVRASASSAYTAAMNVKEKRTPVAYALSRPPGHHASYEALGGFCYINNAALVAKTLGGRVAVIDIDFHHGNGTQEFFYDDPNVFFGSLHADPRLHYPFIAGFTHETGRGIGDGANLNVILPDRCDGMTFLDGLNNQLITALKHFSPEWLVVSAGFDTYELDPLGVFGLQTSDYRLVGDVIAQLGLPTVIVQEGGYYLPHLGRNVEAFLSAFV